MGWVEDSVEEFKKLPPAGKIAFVAAGLGVAVLAYVSYKNSSAGSAGSSSSAGTVTGAFPGGTGVTSVTDPAGGTWTIPPASPPPFRGLWNGTGLPYRTAQVPTATSPATTSGITALPLSAFRPAASISTAG